MQLSQLPTLKTSRSVIDQFAGYNHNKRIQSNEFYDSLNLTSDEYPLMSNRQPRGRVKDIKGNITDYEALVACGDDLFGVRAISGGNREFCCLTSNKPVLNLGTATVNKMIAMGAYVLMFPCKKYVNVSAIYKFHAHNPSYIEYGDIEASFSYTSYSGVDDDEIEIIPYVSAMKNAKTVITTETPSPTLHKGWFWVDANDPVTLKLSNGEKWTSVAYTSLRIRFKGILSTSQVKVTDEFNQGDSVSLTIASEGLSGVNGTYVIDEIGFNYIVITNASSLNQVLFDGVAKIERKMPDMDYMVECNNRLWGCKYGEKLEESTTPTLKTTTINEIYCSKLGDFKNWNCFEGLATDSYVASVGVGGKFTGAIKYGGKPMFFKEHTMFRINGDFPSNYQINEQNCDGVADGSAKSLAVVDGALFYNSTNGVCVYDGSMPTNISYQLGYKAKKTVGACLGNKYYIDMKNGENDGYLFVYDTSTRMWQKEQKLNAYTMCEYADNIYCVVGTEGEYNQCLLVKNDIDIPYEENMEWMAETGLIGLDLPSRKYISRITLRISLEQGSRFNAFIQYDSKGDWENVLTLSGTTTKSFSVPIKPKRCDHFKLKFIGKGGFKMYSISKTIEQGSEI